MAHTRWYGSLLIESIVSHLEAPCKHFQALFFIYFYPVAPFYLLQICCTPAYSLIPISKP